MTDQWRSDIWGRLDQETDPEIARHGQLILDEARIEGFLDARSYTLDRLALREHSNPVVVELGIGPAPYAEQTLAALGARGKWIGVDTTQAFLAAGEERVRDRGGTLEVVCADARDVPLGDACADAVLADKLLIHIAPTEVVAREMARLVRSGGRVAACDAEADAIFVNSSNPSLSRRILRHCADVRPSPTAASHVAEDFAHAGLVEIERRGFMCTMTDLAQPFVPAIIRHWATRASAGGAVTASEADAWCADVLGRAKPLVTFCLIVTTARKP